MGKTMEKNPRYVVALQVGWNPKYYFGGVGHGAPTYHGNPIWAIKYKTLSAARGIRTRLSKFGIGDGLCIYSHDPISGREALIIGTRPSGYVDVPAEVGRS